MKTSDSIKELAAALAKAQAAMGGAHKDSKNPAFNSTYADLSAVVDAIKPHLTANGIAYVQFPVSNDKDEVGVETILMHASGEYIQSDPFFIPVAKANAHGFGSALTYTRRYSLAAACGLKSEDDDGNAASETVARNTVDRIVNGKGTARQHAVDALEALSPEEQDFLRTHAEELQRIHSASGDLYGYVESQRFDTEEKLALWALLPSHVRSAFKKQQQATQLASQP